MFFATKNIRNLFEIRLNITAHQNTNTFTTSKQCLLKYKCTHATIHIIIYLYIYVCCGPDHFTIDTQFFIFTIGMFINGRSKCLCM